SIMSSITLAFSSKAAPRPARARNVVALSSLCEGARATIVAVQASDGGRTDRLLALGVTPGAAVTVLQTFPGIVFLCDQTELAIERGVAASIIVRCEEMRS